MPFNCSYPAFPDNPECFQYYLGMAILDSQKSTLICIRLRKFLENAYKVPIRYFFGLDTAKCTSLMDYFSTFGLRCAIPRCFLGMLWLHVICRSQTEIWFFNISLIFCWSVCQCSTDWFIVSLLIFTNHAILCNWLFSHACSHKAQLSSTTLHPPHLCCISALLSRHLFK